MLYILLFLILITVRFLEFMVFMKKINSLCNDFNWKLMDFRPSYFVEAYKYNGDDYRFHFDWSSHKFLFLKGLSPIKMYFQPKILIPENFYPIKKLDFMEQVLKIDSHIVFEKYLKNCEFKLPILYQYIPDICNFQVEE